MATNTNPSGRSTGTPRSALWGLLVLGLSTLATLGLRADEPNGDEPVFAVAQRSDAYAGTPDSDSATAPKQWHLERLNAAQAWAASTGTGVTIAVIDSGVAAGHPDLQGHVLPGWNMLEDTPDTSDSRGHGTAVAGAAAASFNSMQGVAGIASGARILPLKVTDETGYTSVNAVIKAIHYAADRGARVVNVSFEFVGGHPGVLRAAQYLHERGGLLVVPSGNRGVRQNYPEAPGLITVAATDKADAHPSWSTHGPHVTVSAPGQSLLLPDRKGRYGEVSGTSYASPLVAGVLALMMAADPSASPDELRAALESSARDLGEPGRDPLFGAGRVDAAAAVAALSAQRKAR